MNTDNKCFLWYHSRNLNLANKNPQRKKNLERNIPDSLNYDGIKFPVSKNNYGKDEFKNNILN